MKLTEKKIAKYNKLIGKFMGEENIVDRLPDPWKEILNTTGKIPNSAPYHSSVDWLAGVVEKIMSIGETDSHYGTLVQICNSYARITFMNPHTEFIVGVGKESAEEKYADTLMEATYFVVVEFIEWYNKKMEISKL